MTKLTHLGADGEARMVDVSGKDGDRRVLRPPKAAW
jgi:molybdenum cofactor biosynthesis enzyme